MCLFQSELAGLIPLSLLLAVSFFVLFACRKTDSNPLRLFGYAIALLIWAAALTVFSSLLGGRACAGKKSGGFMHQMGNPLMMHMNMPGRQNMSGAETPQTMRSSPPLQQRQMPPPERESKPQ